MLPYSQILLPRGSNRRIRTMRVLRAIWHDSRALIREFRLPTSAFLLAVFGGGYVYSLLLNHYLPDVAQNFSFADYPWMMIALMVLEPVHEVPKPLPLIAFWYALPILAVYVIGQGAVDFVRLFFNRSDRRDAWEEAVASTYRNHVIIIGLGHVGERVLNTLVDMGFDVVAIDKQISPDKDERLSGLGVPSIVGDAREQSALEKAGIRQAASLIICTSSDHVNLETIMRARDMNPDVRIVARMYDPQFAKQLNRFMGVQATLSSSDLAAPAFAGAAVGIEITQTLKIAGEEYSMIRLDVTEGSILDGSTIDTLQDRYDMDIVLHGADGEMTVHPAGEICVDAGDTLVIFAQHRRITEIVSQNRPRRPA